MSDAEKPRGTATMADLLAIPEADRHHEIIDGEIVEKAAASGRHGGAQFQFGSVFRVFNRRPGGHHPGGWLFATETEIQFDNPRDEILTVHRWTPDGYTEILSALRGERARAEPFDAIEIQAPGASTSPPYRARGTQNQHGI